MRYLRLHDPLGYMMALAMTPGAAAAWARLWSCVRQVDDLSDADGDAAQRAADRTLDELRRDLGPLYIRLEAELRALATYPGIEARLYGDRTVQSIDTYLRILHYKGVLPVYLCGSIAFPHEPPEHIRTYALYIGRGGAILDDTLDLLEDLRHGRVFVTREELDAAGLDLDALQTPDGLRAFTRLRRKWALHYYLRAHRATGLFAPANRDIARSWLGPGLRLLLDDRAVPLPWDVLRDRRFLDHLGSYAAFINLPFPTENSRYEFLHSILGHLVRTTAFADIDSAERRYALDDTPLPQEMIAGVDPNQDAWKTVPLPPPVPEARRTLPLIHYGSGGTLKTLIGLAETLFEPRQNP
jgi:phytoene/squalene synthetase